MIRAHIDYALMALFGAAFMGREWTCR
jgi:hypothetical protein